jgi:hypothetical protein
LPDYLQEFAIVDSAAEALKMSTGEVEDKFTLSQLIIMSTIQNIQFEHEKSQMKNGGRIKNKAATPEEQNKRAWKYL